MKYPALAFLILALFLCGCVAKPTPVVTPTVTAIPVATETPEPPRSTPTPKIIPVVTAPTNEPTVTATPIPWTLEPAVYPTPAGMVCEIEQQWGRGPGHDYEYGCFAISCWFADGSTYGNNLACVDRSIGTPWPYEWFFYHPLMDTLNEEAK